MKTVLITGASSGIGKAIAYQFHSQSWQPILVARNEERLKALSKELGDAPYFVCDLADPNSVKMLAEKIANQFPDLQSLVNNAGVYKPLSVDEDSDEVWDHHYQINLMSAVRLTRGLWPILKKNKASILNISSTLALRPIANTGAYSALKAAMNNWTQTLALEGAEYGVRANVICPGLVDTPIHGFHFEKNSEEVEIKKSVQGIQPLGRIGSPSDIAGAAFHLCSEQSVWTTGAILNIDGGILLNS